MRGKEDVEAEFIADLRAFLAKWDAEIELEDHGDHYPDEVMVASIPGIYDGPEDQRREYLGIELGKYLVGGGQSKG
jgi:hypothetical protein